MKRRYRSFGRWVVLTLLSVILVNGIEASELTITPQKDTSYLYVQGKDFRPLDKIRSVVVFAYDYGGNLINRLYIADYELYCDASGRLFGKIPTAGISAEASRLHVKIATAASGSIESEIDLSSDYRGSHPLAPPTSVTIDDDQNGSGTADPNEVIKYSGSGWGGTSIRFFYQKEYSDISGTNLLATVRIRDFSATISGGDLSGNYTTPSSFSAGAKSIRINLIDDASSEATSAPYIIAESDPPEITSSTAINLTTIQVVFDESLYEKNGDAGERFILTGSDVSGVSISSLEPVGSEPTDTWNILLSGNLADRDPDGVTVSYDSTASSGDPQLQDPAGNQVKNESSSGVADGIAPADPTRISPSASDNFESGVVKWSATADDITTDPSISYLQIEGSNDLSAWTAVGSQDNSVSSTSYHGSYSPGVEYAYYRIMAVDDQGNESYSSVTVNYQDAHHLSITSVPVNEPVNTFEDQITFEVRDAYGNLETVTKTVSLSMLSGTGTPTFRQTPTGSDITQIDLVNASSGSFYFACTVAGTKEIGISASGLVAASQNATISGIASKILIKLPGQSFVNGSGITGPVTAQQAGSSFNVTLYIVDSDNYLVDTETGSRAIDFTSNTGNAPNGTQPTINGNTPDITDAVNWSDISINFSAGVSDNVAIILYKTGSGVNFTASDNSGSPTLTGETSSNLTVNPAAFNDFVFAVATPQTDGLPVSGTNTLTARDVYQNVKTDFDASATPVTLAKNSGPGTLSVKGLHGTLGDELNQATDFSLGVANLTSLGMRLDVSAEGTYQIKATVGGTDKGSSGDVAINFRTAAVSNPSPAADANIDASAANSDLALSADVSQNELSNYDYNDDFQIRWGFSNNADGSSLQQTGSSGDLVVSGSVSYSVPAATLQAGSAFTYFFWWVENVNTTGNVTQLTGSPISGAMRRLIVNPTLQTSGGDVSSGSYAPGGTNQEMVSLQFTPSPSQATIQVVSLDFQKTGTATAGDIDAFHLYEDNGTIGQFDGADNLLASTGYSGGGAVSFSGFTLNAVSPGTHALITVDVNSAANTSHTLGLNLGDQGDVGVGDNVVNGGAGAIQKAAFSNIGTAGDNPLPVTLVSFEAHQDRDKIVIEWQTASEMENEGFFLYRSKDDQSNFRQLNVQIIPGAGSSNKSHSYEYIDTKIEENVIYFYKLISRDYNGQVHDNGIISCSVVPLPETFTLHQNYPNPFNPGTQISFDVAEEGHIRLVIYNSLGQKIKTLIDNEYYQPGSYSNITWNARDDQNRQVANGVYYLELVAPENNFRQVRKVVFMK